MKTTLTETKKVDGAVAQQIDTIVQPAHDLPQDVPLDRILSGIRQDSRRDPQAYLKSAIVWGQGE